MTTPSAPPRRLRLAIDRLAPLPATARRLVAALGGDDPALHEVTRLIEFDQAIAAAVLRISRTAACAGMRPPETVREAVFRLGTVRLLNLLLQEYLRRLGTDAPLYDLGEQDLWRHGAAAELAVRALMQERPKASIPPLAQTAALLHDMGKLILCQHCHVDVRALVNYARHAKVTFVDAERELLGTDHAEVGAAVAEHWQFPEPVIDAIGRHHTTPLIGSTPMLDVVMLANLVAKTLEVGLGAEGFNFPFDASSLQRLRMDFPTFGRVCLQTQSWLADLP
jgi:putative nucleotidyltransferase with HDIG domain